LKSAKPKADKVVIQEPEKGTTTTTPTTIIFVPKPPPDKGKGIMIKEPMVKQVKPMKMLEQMMLDEEPAFKLQAEEEDEEEERLAREKAQQIEEVNIAWDDIQAKIKANYQLAQRLQAQEQEELTDEEKARFSKRAGDELEQENAKKQKVDKYKETAKLQSLMEVVHDEKEVAIDVVPLTTNPPTIINIKFRGGLLGLKAFLMLFGITTVLIDVNAAQSKLVLLDNFNENYSVFKTAGEVTTVSTKFLLLEEVTTTSES
ncbi:hypothetical protein Tco_1287255, partial [Tanacetum coccineum]